ELRGTGFPCAKYPPTRLAQIRSRLPHGRTSTTSWPSLPSRLRCTRSTSWRHSIACSAPDRYRLGSPGAMRNGGRADSAHARAGSGDDVGRVTRLEPELVDK